MCKLFKTVKFLKALIVFMLHNTGGQYATSLTCETVPYIEINKLQKSSKDKMNLA